MLRLRVVKSICCTSVCTVQCATITAALKAKELKGQWSVCTFRSRITTGYSYIYERGRGDEYFLSLEVKTQKSEAGTLHSVVSVGLGIIRSLENSPIRKDGMWSRVSPLLVHIVWTTTVSGWSSGTEVVQVQIIAWKQCFQIVLSNLVVRPLIRRLVAISRRSVR